MINAGKSSGGYLHLMYQRIMKRRVRNMSRPPGVGLSDPQISHSGKAILTALFGCMALVSFMLYIGLSYSNI
jgi:hypothetical protein